MSTREEILTAVYLLYGTLCNNEKKLAIAAFTSNRESHKNNDSEISLSPHTKYPCIMPLL
jgi:hypothetical protein